MIRLILLLMSIWSFRTQAEYSECVIDISHYQKEIDFAKIKNDSIVAVIHKATEGKTYVDRNYYERRIEAEEEGLLWGAYHFANKGNPIGQADHFLNVVGDTESILLVLDLEENRGNNMSPDEAEVFVKRIEERTGRLPLMYGSRIFLKAYNSEILNKCKLWIASFTSNEEPKLPPHRDSWVLWQYTNGEVGGTPRGVDGVTGFCDRDRYNGTAEELIDLWPNL
ncbi:lysozyme M1 [Halyomorpha halys]|uniref:lysozyme M1 n=1 Tax=Halyomorpha halys TaxID=286706 RepID=UPI0006D501FF|nr:uncharacterized protein LOC106680047 [Halyomorpha halys]